MKNRLITLLDLGLDESFQASMMFVQSTLQAINAGWTEPIADIDFVRSRDTEVVFAAMVTNTDVLHVMAHSGKDDADGVVFQSSDGRIHISLKDLRAWCDEYNQPVRASAIFVDGCRSATARWHRALRDCLASEVCYIGTTKTIGWHESTAFSSAFYGALLQYKGKGHSPMEQAKDAAERAVNAYESLLLRPCPYRVSVLEPSQRARRNFV